MSEGPWDTSFDWVLIDWILTVIFARLIASATKERCSWAALI
jgi:hypothetical protein